MRTNSKDDMRSCLNKTGTIKRRHETFIHKWRQNSRSKASYAHKEQVLRYGSMEVYLHGLLGSYEIPTDRPTNHPTGLTTDRPTERVIGKLHFQLTFLVILYSLVNNVQM